MMTRHERDALEQLDSSDQLYFDDPPVYDSLKKKGYAYIDEFGTWASLTKRGKAACRKLAKENTYKRLAA